MGFAQIFEMIFDIAYLIFIWALVCKMYTRRKHISKDDRPVAEMLLLGFFLLALGDTGHVGFRAWGYALGGHDSRLMLGSIEVPMGIGSLMTAYTITVLYMLILEVWRLRYKKKAGFLYFFLQALGVLRLVIMLFPQNQWSLIPAPFDWSLYRNIPLAILGIAVAVLMLIDARKNKDRVFESFAYYIFISYLFYLPVILFYRIAPWVGMFMMPKTVAYLFMAVAAYRQFFKKAA